MNAPRRLALCADDFGQSLAIDRGILALARQGRLQAVSCLTGGAAWAADAAALVQLAEPGGLQIGLHWNLTDGAPLAPALAARWPRFPTLPALIARAHLRALPLAAIGAELQAQWAAFVAISGRTPDFVDGHQHVHHLPGLRDLLLAALPAAAAPALRHTGRLPGPGFAVKRALIAGTGGRALGRQLQRRGLPHNTSLFGVYDFRDPDYRAWMQRWLAALPARGALLFCHPGEAADDAADPIAGARVRELAYLRSDAFADDLVAAGVTLAPAW